jgi:hypothetical protein
MLRVVRRQLGLLPGVVRLLGLHIVLRRMLLALDNGFLYADQADCPATQAVIGE